jgi:periplasmic protein TonB
MFHDVLLEVPAAERRRRKLTLLATIAGEGLVIATLLAIPLLYLDVIPGLSVQAKTLSVPLSGAPAVTGGPAGPRAGGSRALSQPQAAPTVRTSGHPLLPYGRAQRTGGESDLPLDPNGVGACCGVPGSLPDGNFVPPPVRPAKPPDRPLVLSRLDPGMILQRVEPVYPREAKLAHIQGEVVVRAVISRSGVIESVRAVSGHPWLARAARDAVAQWKFRPYYLNGSPIGVETQVTVHFVLGGS